MGLTGKVSVELGVQTTAAKFFNLFSKQLHHVPNIAHGLHEAKVLQGDDWHSLDSVKHWTYIIDGKVTTCKEKIEAIDEQNKSITYNLFEGDINQHYKTFKGNLQVIDKDDGGAIAKWTLEYEKINENAEPPYGYCDYLDKLTKDADNHLLKA